MHIYYIVANLKINTDNVYLVFAVIFQGEKNEIVRCLKS